MPFVHFVKSQWSFLKWLRRVWWKITLIFGARKGYFRNKDEMRLSKRLNFWTNQRSKMNLEAKLTEG